MIIFSQNLPSRVAKNDPKMHKIRKILRDALRLWSSNLGVWDSQNDPFFLPKLAILGPLQTMKKCTKSWKKP